MTSMNPTTDSIKNSTSIGTITEADPARFQFLLSPPVEGSGQPSGGVTEVGSIVLAEAGELAVVAQVDRIRTAEDAASTRVIAHAQILSVLDSATGLMLDGVLSAPAVGGKVRRADDAFSQVLLDTHRNIHEDHHSVLIALARLRNREQTPLAFTPERLFGRHAAVIGSTGSGKSWSVARIAEQCSEFESKVIVFDAAGEFGALGEGTRHVYVGNDPRPAEVAKQVAVPYYHLTESDLFAIFKPHGPSQAPRLRAAMKSLKLARIEPSLAPNGLIVKAHRSKVQFEEEYQRHIAALENPFADFEISGLARQIQNECVEPQRSPAEPLVWGGPNSVDHSYCVPLINRIQDIVNSPNLAPIFNPGRLPSLFKEIHDFLKDRETKILRISLKYLAFEHNAREIIANAIGRYLLDIARGDYLRKLPVLLILDEAHQFLNEKLIDRDESYPLDAFGLIAKEGRKYSLSMCISTQRPRDIPEGVLSQMGTLVVHRLINHYDRDIIERASGELDPITAGSIPGLTPGEAVIVGVDFPAPLSVKMEAPFAKPDSRGPDFQRYWARAMVE